jgi:hypothetical protein
MYSIKQEAKGTAGMTGREYTTYREELIGRTLYCVTSEHRDKVCFAKTIEDFIVKKILSENNSSLVDVNC